MTAAAYRSLDSGKVLETVRLLRRRIEERFAGSGLARVCGELVALTEATERRCDAIGKPNL